MKKLLIAGGAVLAGLAVALVTLRSVGPDPKERRPGLWLTGELGTVLESKAKKYPRQRVADKNLVYVFSVGPG